MVKEPEHALARVAQIDPCHLDHRVFAIWACLDHNLVGKEKLPGKLLTLATLERTTTATTAVVVVVVVVVVVLLLLLLLLTCYSATPARLLPLFVLVVAVEVV